MKKLKLLAIIPAMCLCSCSKSDMYGTYEFRMGKTDGTHFGVSATLYNESATTEKHSHPDYQKMTLKADFGDEFNPKGMVKKYVEKIPYVQDFPFMIESISKVIDEMIPENGELPGYFKLTDYKSNAGTRVQMGTDYFSDFFISKVEQIIDDAGIEITEEVKKEIDAAKEKIDEVISPEMIEKIMCAYISGNTFTLQIPVSIEDIKNELAWNGIFLKVTPDSLLNIIPEYYELNKIAALPGIQGDGRYGVHPAVTTDDKGKVLKDEIAEMNERYKFVFSNTYLYDDSTGETVGTFVNETVDGKQVLYYAPETASEEKEFSGKIVVTDNILGTKTKHDIKFKIDDKNKVLVDYKDITDGEDKEPGFADLDGTEFTFKQIMVNPFVFRDYHDVKVGLQKA